MTLMISLIVFVFLYGNISVEGSLDLGKFRDIILSKSSGNEIGISLVDALIRKIDQVRSLPEHVELLDNDPQLKSDINRIIEASKVDHVTECKVETLKAMLKREDEEFGPEYPTFHAYLKFLNEFTATRCVAEFNHRAMEFLTGSDNLAHKLQRKIFEGGKLLDPPKFKAPTEPYDGSNSNDATINLQARYFISSAAIVMARDVLKPYESIKEGAYFVDIFRAQYENIIYIPCRRFLYSIGLTDYEHYEFLQTIRERYGIYEHKDFRNYMLLCSFLHVNRDDYKKVYRYYRKYLDRNGLPGDHEPNMSMVFVSKLASTSSTRSFLTYEMMEDDITAISLVNPASYRDGLSKLGDVDFPREVRNRYRNYMDISMPSKWKCEEKHLGSIFSTVRLTKIYLAPEAKPFVNEFVKQQMEICEAEVWSSVSDSLINGEFDVMVILEDIRKDIDQVREQQQIPMLKQRPPWIFLGSHIKERSRVRIFYTLNDISPSESIESLADRYAKWIGYICDDYSRGFSFSRDQLSKAIIGVFHDPSKLELSKYSFSSVTLKARMYERICFDRQSSIDTHSIWIRGHLERDRISVGQTYRTLMNSLEFPFT